MPFQFSRPSLLQALAWVLGDRAGRKSKWQTPPCVQNNLMSSKATVLVFLSPLFPWVFPEVTWVLPINQLLSPDKHWPDCVFWTEPAWRPKRGPSPLHNPAAEVKSTSSSLELFDQVIKYYMIKYRRASPDPYKAAEGFSVDSPSCQPYYTYPRWQGTQTQLPKVPMSQLFNLLTPQTRLWSQGSWVRWDSSLGYPLHICHCYPEGWRDLFFGRKDFWWKP